MIEETKRKLYQMKLNGMVEGMEYQMRTPHCLSLPFEDRFGMIVDHEETSRDNKRLKRLVRNAKLKVPAQIESIEYLPVRNLDRAMVANLATCNWIDKGFNVLLTGAAGTGKTYLACALGYQACLKGKHVQFHRLLPLLEDLEQAHLTGGLHKRLFQMNRAALLIIDDFGIKSRMSQKECELILELLDGRHGTGATIVNGQLPIDHWHEYLSACNPTSADAIMDRLTTNAVRIELRGPSMRPHKTPILDEIEQAMAATPAA